MTDTESSIRSQLKRHSVALISLVVAISSLAYNTWRNEQTEANRNVRAAGFQLMNEIARLQQTVLLSHYDMDAIRGNPRVGWTHVIAISDLAYAMPDEVQDSSEELLLVWQENWETLEDSTTSLEKIDTAINFTKSSILQALKKLD